MESEDYRYFHTKNASKNVEENLEKKKGYKYDIDKISKILRKIFECRNQLAQEYEKN